MTEKELNEICGRSRLNRQGRAQTPDDVDRNDQYTPLPLVDLSGLQSAALTIAVSCGLAGLLTLLWWVGRP